jgi:NitT/TauT family transport system permease protein
LIGFLAAALFGVSFGLLIGSSRWLRTLFAPLIELLRPLCPIAWMPFAIAVFKMRTLPQLFGVDYSGTIFDEVQTGMVFVLFWGAFFPILTNTCDGIIGVRKNYITLAKTLGAGKRDLLLRVYLPAALPMILTGLRQGISLCWFVLIAAEMLPGSSSGIGYLLFYASDMAEMNVVIACMVIIGLIGALLNGVTLFLFKKFVSWHGEEV